MSRQGIRRLLLLLLILCLGIIPSVSGEAASLGRPTMKKAQVVNYNALKLSWSAVSGAEGYVLYRRTGSTSAKKIAVIKGRTNCSFTDKSLITGRKYIYTVKAYKRLKTKMLYSAASNAAAGVPAVLAPAITSIKTGGSRQITLGWSCVKGASGYIVYRATAAGGKYTAIKTLVGNTKCAYKDTTVANYKNYYYKVRAFRTVNKKNYYGAVSKYKKFMINVPVDSVSLPKEVHLALGKTRKLTASVLPVNATEGAVVWTSSDPKTVSVKNGEIAALKLGKAVITARAGNMSASCTVTSGLKEVNSVDSFVYESVDLTLRYYDIIESSNRYANGRKTGRLIVKAKTPTLDLSPYAGIRDVVKGFENYYVIQFDSYDFANRAIQQMQSLGVAEYIVEDNHIAIDLEENQGRSANFNSWGVEEMGSNILAQKVAETTADSIVVAVIDTGIDFENEYYKDRLIPGYDLIMNHAKPQDKHSHGTHVAGTIIDCTPGVNVKIMPIRALNKKGAGASLANGLAFLYAIEKGAEVINYSVGGPEDDFVNDMVKRAVKKGVTVVVSAGNDGERIEDALRCSPAELGGIDGVICVAALTDELTKTNFSNYGPEVDVSAPGYFIGSYALQNELKYYNGTSMAAPHISAIAAMEKLLHRSASPAQIEKNIKDHCCDLYEPGYDIYTGYGMPDYTGNGERLIRRLWFVKDSQVITEGREEALANVTYSPRGLLYPDLTWTSSNPKVVTVTERYNSTTKQNVPYIKGIAPGEATITVSTGYGVTGTIKITVEGGINTMYANKESGQKQLTLEPQIAYRDGDTFYRVSCIGGPYADVKDAKGYYLRFQDLNPLASVNLFLDVYYRVSGEEQIRKERFLLQKNQFVMEGKACYYPLGELIEKIPEGREFQMSIALYEYVNSGYDEMNCLYRGMQESKEAFWMIRNK